MSDLHQLLHDAANRATAFRTNIPDRRVFPEHDAIAALDELRIALPDEGSSAIDILEQLDRIASPATVAQPGGRYFGFVTGSSFPATLAANWLASAWDQNSAYIAMSPATQPSRRLLPAG